ncbi:Poly(ADP-ribose) polymerase, catalytic domain [Cinara cedri]|uniref:Poly(ADP-ribose) polymerase, catalytic domain n=1 Tax=Cinara cedri TaxID=506608 RepID=A0A5E4MIK7_9HEMI|nr:Poly(ADP-ribose) polymerase, catalytic domain [Cinara cedri]
MHGQRRRSTLYTDHASRLLTERHCSDQFSPSSPLLSQCSHYKEEQIEAQVHKTFPWCQIDKISQVNQPSMYGMYLLRKKEMQLQNFVQEIQLYHVTTQSKGITSLKNGLNWRLTKRSKFGRGVSFSDDCDYANFYAHFSSREDNRVIIVCTVLVANKWTVKGNSGKDLEVPPETADTTISPNGRVYVKYNDYEFCPMFVVYYRCKHEDLCQSRYFNGKNGPQSIVGKAKIKYVPVVDTKLQKQKEERQQEQQLLKQQIQWKSQQQEEQRLQQEQKRQEDQWRWQWKLQQEENQRLQRIQQEQRQQQQNNNGCLIL